MIVNSVLVTGGASALGIELCNVLVARGVEVILFDLAEQILRVEKAVAPRVRLAYGSVLDPAVLRTAVTDRDAVVHLAERDGVERTEKDKLACLELNVQGTKNVLEASVAGGVPKVVFGSSGEVYGEPADNPVAETVAPQITNVYAASKIAAEHLCHAYSERYRAFQTTILRYFNVYGPMQPPYWVVARFVDHVLNGRQPIVFGEGNQIRSYCYAADAAAATVEALIRDDANSEVLNVGNGNEPISVAELAAAVLRAAGREDMGIMFQPEFDFSDRSADREVANRSCSTQRAAQLLGYEPRVPLSEGLTRVLEAGELVPAHGCDLPELGAGEVNKA